MENWKMRTTALLGEDAMQRLAKAKVAVFGLGGVGGHAVEALARGGIGTLHLFDGDDISETNLNRQLAATIDTIGRDKAEVLAQRCLQIAPGIDVHAHRVFYLPETADSIPLDEFDYIIDAVDTVSAKLELIERAYRANVPIICAMGCGNKLDPTAFRVADLFDTKTDPFARVLRREVKKRGIPRLKVVYSEEMPRTPCGETEQKGTAGRSAPASVSFVPGVAGMILAGEVIKDIAGVH